MSERRDRRAVSAEALCQMGSERIRAPAQLAISQGPAVAYMCDCFRGHGGPAINSFEQIHLETLINKGRRGEIPTAIHHDQARDDGKVVENQQHAPQPWMPLDPAHAVKRR